MLHRSVIQEGLFNAKRVALIAVYCAWILLFRLFCLSFLVYFLTRAGHTVTFKEINESFANNEVVFIGLSSALFLALLKGFSPLLDRANGLSLSWREIRSEYLPGFFEGALLALSVVAGFILVGTYRYVGFFVQLEDTGLAILGILLRIFALLALGLSEEYLFRDSAPFSAVRILGFGLLYCVVKLAQFDLSWMQFGTLFLLSCCLAIRRSTQSSYLNGAGFWSAMLVVFHPLFSLPVFGNDFSGIFLLKYQTQRTLPAMVSGGIGGPLSGIAFQMILLLGIVRALFAHKKSLLNVPANL